MLLEPTYCPCRSHSTFLCFAEENPDLHSLFAIALGALDGHQQVESLATAPLALVWFLPGAAYAALVPPEQHPLVRELIVMKAEKNQLSRSLAEDTGAVKRHVSRWHYFILYEHPGQVGRER